LSNIKISALKIQNYRGLNNLTLDDLTRVNIFVGTNNCGKTSILEAIRILSEANNVANTIRVALTRVKSSEEAKRKYLVNYLLSAFQAVKDDEETHKNYVAKLAACIEGVELTYDVDATIGKVFDTFGTERDTLDVGIKTSFDGKSSYKISTIENGREYKYSGEEKPFYNCMYFHSSVNYYYSCTKLLTDYIAREGKGNILHILRTFDKNIDDVSILGEDIYLSNKWSGSLPLFAYGLGMQKALLLAVAIVSCRNGVILIDEIDNAIHVSVFEEVFRWFLDACVNNDVQAFITTHSLEALDAVLKIAHENHCNDDLMRIVTLRKDYDKNITKSKVRTGEEAYEDREDFGMELRV